MESSTTCKPFACPPTLVGHYEDILVACELHGDNNCWTWDNKKRSRDWYPIAIGSEMGSHA